MSSDNTSTVPFDVDDFPTNIYDSTIDDDDCMLNVEPHDINEECEVEDPAIEISSINEEFQPFVGMEFENYKEAYDFYNFYGYVNGFSIRRGGSYKNTEGKMTSFRLVCSKSGLKESQKACLENSIEVNVESLVKTPQRESSIKRCDCKASIQVRLHKNEMWGVTAFHEDHNHELVQSTLSKKRNLRSHKYIPVEQKQDVQYLKQQNVGTAKVREYLACKNGGRQNLCFKMKDLNNEVASESRKLVGVEVDTMINYFLKKKEVDPDFFFAIEPDENDVAMNIFWVDGRSRRAYEVFGDVVVFDTTYSTNKFSMPATPFVGLNHHRHNIYFGCALVRQENKMTFKWLFETWLQAMGGKHPIAIITDQDQAMKVAIAMVFPNTIHRRCQWHVLRKARDHLGVLYGSKLGFKAELVAVIDYSLTVSDFETNWKAMVKKYQLEENSHLKHMFKSSNEWAPAYFHEIFTANMSTSQRSESMNAAMKIWMTCNTSLYRFAVQFDKMVEGIYEKESDEDILTMNETPSLCSYDLIEAEARKVYT